MIVEELELFTVSPGTAVRGAMEAINENASGIVLVVDDERRLLGTVTDGDIRRAILNGRSLDDDIEEVMHSDPFFISEGFSDTEVVQLSRDRGLRQIPILDEESVVRGLFLRDASRKPGGDGEVEDEITGDAVVMAGGLGTRLRPHTEETPKPLVEVCGKPILEHIVEHLSEAGVDRLFITTRYLAEQIEDYFEDGTKWGVDIEYIREEKRLGTAGGLKELAGTLDRATLVMNGDLVTDFDVNEMFRFHSDRDAAITMGVRHYEMKVPYGVAELEDIEVRGLSEKPEFDFFVNAGIYVVEPDVIDCIPRDTYYDITSLVEDVLGDEKVVGFPIVEQWLDIGRPEDLERANRELELD